MRTKDENAKKSVVTQVPLRLDPRFCVAMIKREEDLMKANVSIEYCTA